MIPLGKPYLTACSGRTEQAFVMAANVTISSYLTVDIVQGHE